MSIPTTILRQGQGIAVRERPAVMLAGAVWREVNIHPFRVYIGVIMAATLFYFYVLAAPLYVSQTQFAIKSKATVATVPMLAALIGQTSTGSTELGAITNYIKSPEMLAVVEKKLHIRDVYSQPRLDFLYHLPVHATQNQFLRFYLGMLQIDIDNDASIINLQVKGFDAPQAKAMAQAILDQSSQFIDQMSDQMRNESIRSSQIDYNYAKAEDVKARLAVTNFHSATGSLSPVETGTAAATAIATMESQIVQLNSQIASLKIYNTDSSPMILQYTSQVKYLQDKIAETRKQMAGDSKPDTLNGQLDSYHDLAMNQTYADQRLAVAQAALDSARSVADQRQLFVVPITHPNLPDESTMPRKLLGILSVLAIAAAFYAILALTLAGVRDHRGG